jgi:glutamate dehydrogenase
MAQDSKPDVGRIMPGVAAALAQMPEGVGRREDIVTFARLLLESAGADAVAGYDPKTLAAFAREAFAFVYRRAGSGVVRVEASDLPEGAGTRRVATVQTLNDDKPFLVDSVMGEIRANGLAPLLVVHPVFKVRRGKDGTLQAIVGPSDRDWREGGQESYIAAILDPIDEMVARRLETTLPVVLGEVAAAVGDWRSMLERLDQAIARLQQVDAQRLSRNLAEAITFCRWLRDGNFTLLGIREHRLDGAGKLAPVMGSELGILRSGIASMAPPCTLASPRSGAETVCITKSPAVARVHRRVAMDRVTISIPATDGTTAGALEILGLLTSSAYTQSPRTIPLLSQKVAAVMLRSGHPPESHDGKALINVLETFPRDELFQIGEDQLASWADAILELELRPRARLLLRCDAAAGIVAAIVFVPRDRFSTSVREKIGAAIAEACRGRIIAFTPFFPEGPLVRVHFVLAGEVVEDLDLVSLEARVAALTRTWEDQLTEALGERGEAAAALSAKYRHAFTAGYQELFAASRALDDIDRMERLGPARPLAIDFYRASDQPASRLHAAVYRFDAPIPLSQRVPVLENLGFSVIDERSYRLLPRLEGGMREIALHDMVLETADAGAIDLSDVDTRLEACFQAVLAGDADNDAFNRLVSVAGAEWREAALLRAYASYMRQIRSPFGLRYIAETLASHPGAARDLLALFKARFDPDSGLTLDDRSTEQVALKSRIEAELARVTSLDEDRILRQIMGLIAATVRTNFFQRQSDGAPHPLITFKLDSRQVDGLPEPRPYREIWVYGPRVEGVHLRFSPVARGGIRWSDRAQDFRTEVLGLCKAQQVKNAVIVPNGAKGGFLPKQLPRGGVREEVAKEGIAAYRMFIGALLDLTDNIKDGAIVPPERVVRHDGDDPYLVVAADKGTATFSDTANEIALSRTFWLGDAFASGGSAGYDHKRMGITARGAWECVKRHFREMDRDIQTSPFTVIGVGDMSGDVFGNGMLLSPSTRLLAAFDHRDIFFDPNPDPATSLAERQRLFELPRSSWQDYDKGLISRGGGVFSRAAKTIAVTNEMQLVLGITETSLTPAELIRTVLRAPVDLIWLGGIGTYIKASDESDEQVGDRANDTVRVVAAEVKARVVGEGANLGVTQRGRVELARAGCRIDTDFIDNSAGVNTSDQEVNIKIALAPAVAGGRLDPKARRALLASMTGEVGAGSLRNNYQQSLALSLAELCGAGDVGYLQRLMQVLEGKKLLDRRLEALPSNAEMAQRQAAGRGLVRPELCVLLSIAKISLTTELLATAVPDAPRLSELLLEYFPPAMREAYADGIEGHRLRREIITTLLTNGMINRGGPAFAVRMSDETGRSVTGVAQAFLSARHALGLPEIWRQIDGLDGKVSGGVQLGLYARVQDVLVSTTRWFARQGDTAPVSEADVAETVTAIRGPALGRILTEGQRRRLAAESETLAAAGTPEPLRGILSTLHVVAQAPAIAALAKEAGCGFDRAAPALFRTEEQLRLADLETRAPEIVVHDHFDRLAIDGALAGVRAAAERMARHTLQQRDTSALDGDIASVRLVVDEVLGNGALTASRLTVAAQRVRDLMGA